VFANALGICSSFNVTNNVSHPYKKFKICFSKLNFSFYVLRKEVAGNRRRCRNTDERNLKENMREYRVDQSASEYGQAVGNILLDFMVYGQCLDQLRN
jgi:hypothetical protein